MAVDDYLIANEHREKKLILNRLLRIYGEYCKCEDFFLLCSHIHGHCFLHEMARRFTFNEGKKEIKKIKNKNGSEVVGVRIYGGGKDDFFRRFFGYLRNSL